MSLGRENIKQPFWALSITETLKVLATEPNGLREEETEERLSVFGTNEIKERHRLNKTTIFLNQLISPLILVLIVAGAITIFFKEWINVAVIFAAVLVNSILGFWQENKAETILDLLKSYVRIRAYVRRDGAEREIDASELVPGDIIKLTQGNRVPADARLIVARNLEIDESVLTGESLPVEKNLGELHTRTDLAERKPMVFRGTLVSRGLGEAVVTSIGDNTEFGKIAKLIREEKREPTPLQKSITQFTIRAGLILGVLVALIFSIGIQSGKNIYEMFLIAVAIAVSAVPEGLPIALTVILAIGVQRLSKKNGVIRKLLAAETLGSTTIILTDKTGTLTEAKMEINKIIPYGGVSEEKLLKEALINTDIFGNPVEVAIIKGAKSRGIETPKIDVLDKFPFNPELKFAATIYMVDSKKITALLGAPERVLDRSTISAEEKSELLKKIDELAYAGHRVLGVASAHGEKFENLLFLGLIALKDPIRPNVKAAIKSMEEAGVRTIIVTGDHKGTAEAVARELGLVDGRGAVLTSEDMAHLSPEEFKNRLEDTTVFARVTPKDKMAIVKVFKDRGEIVAMTGDGINDAPALKSADIGIAVGSGTDVAKSAADLIILDDNFETIVAAIEEGRRILSNIKKVIIYLLSNSLDELFLIGGSLLAGIAMPLNALQILLVNFFADSFPALAFAFEKEGGRHNSGQSKIIFDKKVKVFVLGIGSLTSALLFALYFSMLKFGFPEHIVKTFIFAAFATYTLFLSFALRNLDAPVWSYNIFSNKYLNTGVLIGIFLTLITIYLPIFQRVFDTVPLPLPWLGGVFLMGIFNILVIELGKWLLNKKTNEI